MDRFKQTHRPSGRRENERAREREREKRRKQERRARRKRLHCKKTTQTVVAGCQQVQWAGVCPALPCPVCHHRQTDTTVAFIYKICPLMKVKMFMNLATTSTIPLALNMVIYYL
jgi:hypothetical protein